MKKEFQSNTPIAPWIKLCLGLVTISISTVLVISATRGPDYLTYLKVNQTYGQLDYNAPDNNKNGLHDEVEDHIKKLNISDKQKAGLAEYAFYYQKWLDMDIYNIEDVDEKSNSYVAGFACLVYSNFPKNVEYSLIEAKKIRDHYLKLGATYNKQRRVGLASNFKQVSASIKSAIKEENQYNQTQAWLDPIYDFEIDLTRIVSEPCRKFSNIKPNRKNIYQDHIDHQAQKIKKAAK